MEKTKNFTWKEKSVLVSTAVVIALHEAAPDAIKGIARSLFGIGAFGTSVTIMGVLFGVTFTTEGILRSLSVCGTLMLVGIGLEVFRKKK